MVAIADIHFTSTFYHAQGQFPGQVHVTDTQAKITAVWLLINRKLPLRHHNVRSRLIIPVDPL